MSLFNMILDLGSTAKIPIDFLQLNINLFFKFPLIYIWKNIIV